MKKKMTVLLTAIALVGFAQFALGQNVPKAIEDKFAAAYPGAKEVEWEAEEGNWEAEYEMGEDEGSVTYDVQGNLVETEIQMAPEDLPQAIRNYVAQHAGGKKIKEAAKITDANGKVTYEAEAGGKDYLFDDAGNFLKMEDGD